jgi:hypothetical protein
VIKDFIVKMLVSKEQVVLFTYENTVFSGYIQVLILNSQTFNEIFENKKPPGKARGLI